MRLDKHSSVLLIILALFYSCIGTSVIAGESATSITNAGMPAQCSQYAAKVSASEGNWSSVNGQGCVGAFQFCPGTFEQYYSGSKSSFLNDPSAQVAAWTKYQQNEWNKSQRNGLTSLVGQQVCYSGKCAIIDQSSILMACQFGCGKGGKLYNYSQGQDCNARNVKDGNLHSVCSYLIKGSGYDVSCFTGQKRADANCTPSDYGDPNLPGPGYAQNSSGGTLTTGSGAQASASPADMSSVATNPPTYTMATIILESGAAALEPDQMPAGISPPLTVN